MDLGDGTWGEGPGERGTPRREGAKKTVFVNGKTGRRTWVLGAGTWEMDPKTQNLGPRSDHDYDHDYDLRLRITSTKRSS